MAVVIGIAGTLYGSFGVGFAAQNAMNTVWNIPYVRWASFWTRYLRTFGVIGLLGLAVASSTALTAFATAVAHGAAAPLMGQPWRGQTPPWRVRPGMRGQQDHH